MENERDFSWNSTDALDSDRTLEKDLRIPNESLQTLLNLMPNQSSEPVSSCWAFESHMMNLSEQWDAHEFIIIISISNINTNTTRSQDWETPDWLMRSGMRVTMTVNSTMHRLERLDQARYDYRCNMWLNHAIISVLSRNTMINDAELENTNWIFTMILLVKATLLMRVILVLVRYCYNF